MSVPGRPTIHDVARLAGVSPTTVSHAFTGNGKVSALTRGRVREAARALGYRRDVIATGARANRLGIIALVVRNLGELQPDIRRGVDYFTRFTGSASLATLNEGYGLVLIGDPLVGDSPGTAMASDGFIVTEPLVDDPLVASLDNSGIPYVTVGESPSPRRRPAAGEPAGTPSGGEASVVDIETERLTLLALRHLADRGASRIALVVGTASNEWNLRTRAVYHRWCRHHGGEPVVVARREMMGPRGGHSAARVLFDRDDPPDAVYCLVASHAIGLVEHLARRDLRVPDGVRIVVGSDSVQARDAALTAIDLQPEELARRAVELLLSRIHGYTRAADPPGLGRLIVRESS